LWMFIHQSTFAQPTDFSHAMIVCSGQNNVQLKEAVVVMQQVIEEHSNILLPVTRSFQTHNTPLIVVCTSKQEASLPKAFYTSLNKLSPTGKDGYKITFLKDEQTIIISGFDERGALYGVGYLLRKIEMRRGQILIPGDLDISSTPNCPIRGHQLGYRPKTNAYDAWTVDQFDHYIQSLMTRERGARRFPNYGS
jgi:alpha-glucuronidase